MMDLTCDSESGLGMLSTLNIRKLGFQNLRQELGEDDVRWMVKTWTRLTRVDGSLNGELTAILRENRISVYDEYDAI